MAKLVNLDEIVQLLTEAPSELLAQPRLTKRFILMVGPQGAGKSTIAKAIKKQGYKRLSYDRLAKRNPFVNDNWLERRYNEWLAKSLAAKSNIVDDNLNTIRERRKRIIDKALAAGYTDIRMVYIDAPLELCLAQNAQRERQTPEWILKRAWLDFQQNGLPTPGEAAVIVRILPTSEAEVFQVEEQVFPDFALRAEALQKASPGLPQSVSLSSLWSYVKTRLRMIFKRL
jgi:predicted kinase